MRRPIGNCRILSLSAAFVAAAVVVLPSWSRGQDVDRAAANLMSRHRAELDTLAVWCDEQGLEEQAKQTRAWLAPRDPSKLYVAVLTDEIGSDRPPDNASVAVLEWHERFHNLRREQAQAMYDVARGAVRAGRGSLALDLVLAAVREDPDNVVVRRILGFQAYQGHWRTAYDLENLRAGKVYDERFGWLPASFVSRYENGERYYRGRWISAEEDARLHQDIRRGWDIETEHYTIRTNHSIESGVALGRKLEVLYRVWKQLFFRYFASEAQLAELFRDGSRGQTPSAASTRHAVVYFRNRDDYDHALEAIPGIEVSVGIYMDRARRAYFFAGEGRDERTLLHEATHQLFHESRRVASDVGGRNNFWIVEGIAMYMESLREEDGYYVLGGFDDARIRAARYRLFEDNFYVPLAEFSSYGMSAIQQDKRIATLYSQAAGLTHFLIHYDGGRYRDQLVAYLVTVYGGQATTTTLSQLTDASYGTLDRQYRQFMESGS